MKIKGFAFLGTTLAALAMVVGVSCGGGESSGSEQTVIDGGYGKHDINITIWAADAVCQTFASQAQAYADSVADTWDIGFRVQAVSEDVAATNMATDLDAGADIFCTTQEQLARLVQTGSIAPVSQNYVDVIAERNDDISVATSKLNDRMYAYPLTSDNGYFMYYDKSVFPDQSDGSVNANLENMEDIIATLKAAGNRKIYYELSGGYYAVSYFIGAGCHCIWSTDENGNFVSYDDDYDSEAGCYALMETYELMSEESIFVASSDGSSAFKSGAGVCISGIWNSVDVQTALGENFGATDLPSVTTENGDTFHLGSFSGCKVVCCKPQDNGTKLAACQGMANFLTNEESQLERYAKHGWGPSNKNAKQNEAVQSDVALNALWLQNEYGTSQGQFPYEWWDLVGGLSTSYKASSSHDYSAASSLMKEYKNAINSYLDV